MLRFWLRIVHCGLLLLFLLTFSASYQGIDDSLSLFKFNLDLVKQIDDVAYLLVATNI